MGIIQSKNEEIIYFDISSDIYDLFAIKEASYRYSEKYYIFIEKVDDNSIRVNFKNKGKVDLKELNKLADNFMNELLEQQLRVDLEKRFGGLRDQIIRKAFGDKDANGL